MDDFSSYRIKVEKALALKLIDIYESGKITQEQVAATATYLNNEFEKINSKTDLSSFLETVSARWPALSGVVLNEKADSSENADSELYSGVLALAQNGKIDKALKLAKSNNN